MKFLGQVNNLYDKTVENYAKVYNYISGEISEQLTDKGKIKDDTRRQEDSVR